MPTFFIWNHAPQTKWQSLTKFQGSPSEAPDPSVASASYTAPLPPRGHHWGRTYALCVSWEDKLQMTASGEDPQVLLVLVCARREPFLPPHFRYLPPPPPNAPPPVADASGAGKVVGGESSELELDTPFPLKWKCWFCEMKFGRQRAF